MLTDMDLSDFRNEYLQGSLKRSDLDPDPLIQFEKWFQQAISVKLHEPNAMVLSTVDEQLQPSSRTVLLKYFDKNGFVFFTNYQSSKAAEIAFNPKVSAIFPWLPLERQVIIRGHAEKISRMDSLKYFLSRPRDSQLGAWVSQQSSVVSSRSLLEIKFQQMKQKFADGQIPIPDHWGGYRIVPATIEFWQGGPGRIHDRLRYYLDSDNNWNIERLQP